MAVATDCPKDKLTYEFVGSDSDWLEVETLYSENNGWSLLYKAQNNTGVERNARIRVTATYNDGSAAITKEIDVRQLAMPEPTPTPGFIECNLGVVEKEAPATTVDVPFQTDAVSYVVTTSEEWISISDETAVSADHTAQFKLSLDVNNGEKTRVGVVKVTATFSDNTTKDYYLPVIQHAYTNYFICPTRKYDLEGSGRFTVYIPAICNPDPAPVGNVKFKVDKTWVHLPENTTTSSTNTWYNFPRAENPLIFTINANSSWNSRTCNLTLQWTDPEIPGRTVEWTIVFNQPGN